MRSDDGGETSARVPAGSGREPDGPQAEPVELLEQVELPRDHAEVLLASGRSVELETATDGDRLIVRAPGGRVVVRLGITDAGARLELDGSELELRTQGRLRLAAEDIALSAERDIELHAGRDVVERVAGSRHVLVRGAERLEAARIELQANREAVRVRAMEHIALDGARIGLNDDPRPQPFDWSAIAGGASSDAEESDLR